MKQLAGGLFSKRREKKIRALYLKTASALAALFVTLINMFISGFMESNSIWFFKTTKKNIFTVKPRTFFNFHNICCRLRWAASTNLEKKNDQYRNYSSNFSAIKMAYLSGKCVFWTVCESFCVIVRGRIFRLFVFCHKSYKQRNGNSSQSSWIKYRCSP